MSPVGHLVFKTSEVHKMRLVGSTPTSSANIGHFDTRNGNSQSASLRPKVETSRRTECV